MVFGIIFQLLQKNNAPNMSKLLLLVRCFQQACQKMVASIINTFHSCEDTKSFAMQVCESRIMA